ncbi:MAG: toxin-antitoxin system [Synechococcaceae bacterium WB9_4xB_025]|jgi:plasmid stability protein|nr:toxin-antitoxin system [Synechococcaceae bacterium WB9_4xB_025]
MAQLLVRQLDPAVKEALQRQAQRHGRSMEEEVRLILRRAVELEPTNTPANAGLGSRISALFAEAPFETPIPEWRGEAAQAAAFES